MKIVLDTCALLWWTLDPSQLSARAGDEIENSQTVIVSSISIWELGIKIKRNKLAIPLTIRRFAELLSQVTIVEVVAVDEEIWLKNLELDWDHKDPADRTIVATATHYSSPLVTADATIAGFYPRTIW